MTTIEDLLDKHYELVERVDTMECVLVRMIAELACDEDWGSNE